MNDLVLKGGKLIDPSQGLDKVIDIAFAGGKVAAIGDNLTAKDDEGRQRQARHARPDRPAHPRLLGRHLARRRRRALARTGGVTTFIDAGSAGPGNFHGFRTHVIEPSPVRILPYLNVAFPGIFAFSKTVMVGECSDMRLIDPREAVRVAPRAQGPGAGHQGARRQVGERRERDHAARHRARRRRGDRPAGDGASRCAAAGRATR